MAVLVPTVGSYKQWLQKMNAKDKLSENERLARFKNAGINDEYLNWAIRSYSEDGISTLQQLPEVFEYLSIFDDLKKYNYLDSAKNLGNFIFNERDINSYCGLSGCKIKYVKPGLKDWLIKYHSEDIEAINTRIIQKVKLDEGTEKVFETDNVLIIHPKTQESSCRYGAGTKWCTAADKNNMFNAYDKKGPLYIVIDKNTNLKYQFHFPTNQYMDSEDEPIELNKLFKMIPDLKSGINYMDMSLEEKINIMLMTGVFSIDNIETELKKITVLKCTRIDVRGVRDLSLALSTNSTLTSLDLSENSIGDEGATSLASALLTNSTLTTLIIWSNSIGDMGAMALASSLNRNSTLTTLNLAYNSIEAEGAMALASALRTNFTLTTLDLAYNSIGDVGATELAPALITNSTLTDLDLTSNSIGDTGVYTLTSALRINSTLTTLNLGVNYIGDTGATDVASALRVNSTLTTLILWSNSIGDVGATALASSLHINSTLTTLNLWSNSIGATGAKDLASSLHINSTLTTLNLVLNSIGNEGAKSLALALRTNSTLTTLDLRNNSIGDSGAKYLAQALLINSTLTTLNLESNSIGFAGRESLKIFGKRVLL